jgi:DNA-binding MarR family transcriptional regulator/ribosomal protein S18 acetylase RimI-like enzyme
VETDPVRRALRFCRFYDREVGAPQEALLDSSFSPAEVRVILELARAEETTATELREVLRLDAGYLSRILAKLQRAGLVGRRPSRDDARRRLVSLTTEGASAAARLDRRAEEEMREMLAGLAPRDRRRLVEAMATIEDVLAPRRTARTVVLRQHEPGDVGWVVHRHGVLYAREYGRDERFEVLVARIVADFVDHYDPRKERCWIAEIDGERAGCVFVVKAGEAGDAAAELRLLLVEPEARGLGLGTRLVEECIRFARTRGYEKLTLRTDGAMEAALRICEEQGFELVEEEEHRGFAKDLGGQRWELVL